MTTRANAQNHTSDVTDADTEVVFHRDPARFIGRDIAWLRFNERVIAEAADPKVPVLDRLRFLAISGSNLDEFFMKRVALLRHRLKSGLEKRTHDGLNVRQQLEACQAEVARLQAWQAELWKHTLRPELATHGIRVGRWCDLNHEQRGRVDTWFHDMVFPILTPLAVDPGHPFPFISNLSLSLGVLLSDPGSKMRRFARVKIPDGLLGYIGVPESGPVGPMTGPPPMIVVPVPDVVEHNLHEIFPGMTVHETLLFRVTRGAGLEEDEEDIEDLMEFVQESLRHRRFAEAVRLETTLSPSPEILSLLLEELELGPESHYARAGLLDVTVLNGLTEIDAPDLKRPRWQPVVPPAFRDADRDVFSIIREGDVFLHHPYESFDSSVARLIHEAAKDPDVLAIKQCLYRTDPDSPFIRSLIAAADSGKQVSCIVELRARFDEDRNLQLTRRLEKHGIHVAYGIMGYKTHSKVSLIVRREGERLRAYGHIGTGNYHATTARLYGDVGLMTCRPEITDDLIELFNFLTGRSRHSDYKKLLVAPLTMRRTFNTLIDAEITAAKAGQPSGIRIKMNQLEDPQLMTRLIEASQAGVPVELCVRGFCCLRPGVSGLTDNIRVVSIIGQFLEHARIFHFRAGSDEPEDGRWFFGSADWMRRNVDRRVEVITPVEDARARRQLARILKVNFSDSVDGWEMQSDGTYRKLEASPAEPGALGTFATLCQDAMCAETDSISRSELSYPSKQSDGPLDDDSPSDGSRD